MWNEKFFAYCERAGDPAFWAEPLNALSNTAFFVAAIACGILLARSPASQSRHPEWGLVMLIGVIGAGSFLFHTYATRWAAVADTAPIGLFMIGYVAYASRRFLQLNWFAVAGAVALFLVSLRMAGSIPCDPALLPITLAAGRPCFNGSLAYLPALGALGIVGAGLLWRRHPAAWPVIAAGIVFAMSLSMRTLDFELCAMTRTASRSLGTHFVWHVLNAVVLCLLARAAIIHGQGSTLSRR